MPKLDYFMVCESVSVDAASNRISLFLIAPERWQVDAFPHFMAQLAVVTNWTIAPEDRGQDFQVCIKLSLPNGQGTELRRNFTPETEVVRPIAYFLALQMDGPGKLTFQVELNGKPVAVKSIDVVSSG